MVDGMLLFAGFVSMATPVIVITGRGQLQLDNMKLIFHKNESLLSAEIGHIER